VRTAPSYPIGRLANLDSSIPIHALTTFKSVDKLQGDLVVNAHQASYGGFVEAEGAEAEGGFSTAGDGAVTIEGGDALEGDLLGHAVYGEIAGNLYAGLASEGDHLWQPFNFRRNKLSSRELVGLEYIFADVAVTLYLVALEVSQVGGELGGGDRDAAIRRDDQVARDGRGGALGVIGEVNADELLCDYVSCRRPIRVKGSVDARSLAAVVAVGCREGGPARGLALRWRVRPLRAGSDYSGQSSLDWMHAVSCDVLLGAKL
jgi:hypothetical protein